jgi:GT2 family glycosyltransferase/glycosyltransferase involved in cell wall biosynthesis
MPTGASSSSSNSEPVKVVFAACTQDLIDQFVDEVARMGQTGLPILVVSEFEPTTTTPHTWVAWMPHETLATNRGRLQWRLAGRRVAYSCILAQPRQPYWRMRWMGFALAPLRTYVYNENYGHFPLHPRGVPQILRHLLWRAKNLVKQETQPGGELYTFLWRLKNPLAFERPLLISWARGRKPLATAPLRPMPEYPLEDGITVVIPSRDGRHLLQQLLPQLEAAGEAIRRVIVVDNGSSDDTASLAGERVEVIVKDYPMSFAAAVNAGIAATRTRYVCLLNNDMVIEDGFFPALERAFAVIPDLFCATAQIFFPEGQRRQETGKAVFTPGHGREFPLRCDTPLEGENYSPVLYGSGGCSLYDTRKLWSIGGFKEAFRPAYVEDLDAGFRGWQQGWPSVFVSDAKVVHFHRSTTARFLAASTIELAIEQNYLRFILSSVATQPAFGELWKGATERLNHLAAIPEPAPIQIFGLRFAALHKPYYAWDRPAEPRMAETSILALGSGQIACFPGQADATKPCVILASCYLPFPLSHGGAVRMFNLMREAAKDYTLVLMSFVDEFSQPADELLALCAEVIEVKRKGSHYRRDSERPKAVSDFDSAPFLAQLQQSLRRWKPQWVQLEFTQMAQYAKHCAPAKTLLIEHDITLDLYNQLRRDKDDFDLAQEQQRWERFERQAWTEVDAVVVMSEKDQGMVTGARRVAVLENGVDLERFARIESAPEPGRILFIGSFAHLPNLMALDWFVREVWPRLQGSRLHVIAGRNPDYYLNFYRNQVAPDLSQPGIEVEGFVSDVRPAYARAELVIAPLLASAGTNIKVMEAMACGRAIVATPGGVNGLSIEAGKDFLLAANAEEFAAAIARLQGDTALRIGLEAQARATAEQRYGWVSLGRKQKELYESLRA